MRPKKGEMSDFAIEASGPPDLKRARVAPPPPRLFLDAASSPLVETLTLRITGTRLETDDQTYCGVEIRGPKDGGAGIYSAIISSQDALVFRLYKCIDVSLALGEYSHTTGHSICLIWNSRLETCELHDPNGSVENTFPDIAPGLVKAIHRGLLRPLISPELDNPASPFSVSVQNVYAIQVLEQEMCARAAEKIAQLEEGSLKQKLVAVIPLLDDNGGFCVGWTLFKQLDNYRNELKFYDHVQKVMQQFDIDNALEHGGVANNFIAAAYGIWIDAFCEQFDLSAGEGAQSEVHDLFDYLAVPILLRLLCAYFYHCFSANVRLGMQVNNIESIVWPHYMTADDDLRSALNTIYEHAPGAVLPEPSFLVRVQTIKPNFLYPGLPPNERPAQPWRISVDTRAKIGSRHAKLGTLPAS